MAKYGEFPTSVTMNKGDEGGSAVGKLVGLVSAIAKWTKAIKDANIKQE
jgi:hypothetical protein